MEVTLVSARDSALDMQSSRMEVSPLRRLLPDARVELASVRLLILLNRLVAEKLKGNGGIGLFGTVPAFWLHKLADLGR
jgi:hypothetical protein